MRTTRLWVRSAALGAVLGTTLGAAPQQARDPFGRKPSTESDAAVLSRGWGAVAAGQIDAAVQAATEILTRTPGHHAALDLKIGALASTQPIKALDAYEAWLAAQQVEDVFLLAPIARGTLEQLASDQDRAIQTLALERLSRAGEPTAAARLQALAQSASPATDLQLALAGNTMAAIRLLQPAAAASVPPQALAQALPAGGTATIPMLRTLLKHAAGPVRASAALSLGKLGATEAIPDLKPLMNDPEVRSFAAVALTRLGESEGEPVVQALLDSSVLDARLLGAEAYPRTTPGRWVDALMPLLRDPNGLNRVRAAELLLKVAPDAAQAALLEAAADPNPVVRADVSRVLERTNTRPEQPGEATPQSADTGAITKNVAVLRRMLRDTDPNIRLHAAGAILELTSGH